MSSLGYFQLWDFGQACSSLSLSSFSCKTGIIIVTTASGTVTATKMLRDAVRVVL